MVTSDKVYSRDLVGSEIIFFEEWRGDAIRALLFALFHLIEL